MRNINLCVYGVTHTSFACFAELLCVGKTPRLCGLPQMWESAWSEWAEGKSPEPVHHHDLLLQKGRSRGTDRDTVSVFSSLCHYLLLWKAKLNQSLSFSTLCYLLPSSLYVTLLFCFSRTWYSSLMTVTLWKILFCLPLSLPSLRAKRDSIWKLYLGNFWGDQKTNYVYTVNYNVKNQDLFQAH